MKRPEQSAALLPFSLTWINRMYQIIALICSLTIDHDHCDLSNALDTIRFPAASSVQRCAFTGQTLLAPTALVPHPESEYLKIMCVRARPR